LSIATFNTDTGTAQVNGIPGNPVGDGLGPYTLSPPASLSDQINPLPAAMPAFIDSSMAVNALTRNTSNWKSLFLAWPFENLGQADADELMDTTLGWFDIPPNPTAAFSASLMVATVGETITFTSTSLNATAYLWDFGDGVTSTITNPTHIYTSAMTATVQLTSSNCCGIDTFSRQIQVGQQAHIIFLPLTSKSENSVQGSGQPPSGVEIVFASLIGFGFMRATRRKHK
jgi:PKD repeat protein